MSLIDDSLAIMMKDGGGSDVSVVSLSVNENGTYTAPSRTAYSPVTVDTGVYTGVTAPDNSLGKDGDYYYQINDLKASISFELDAIQNSSTYRLGHVFYVDEPTVVYGFSGYYRRANDNIKFLLLDDQANIIYESATMTSVANEWNNLVIDAPISIEANKIYWVMMDMPRSYGCYVGYNSGNVWSNFDNIHIEKGVYYQNNSYSYDNDNIYMATILMKDSYYNISNEYVKNNNAWILLSSTDKIPTTTLSVTENGTYNAPTGTAYSSVSVDVGPEIITRSDWNALTTAQKQAKGFVAIQDSTIGFQRGIFVNGADYLPDAEMLYYGSQNAVSAVSLSYTVATSGTYQIILNTTHGDVGEKNNLAITVNGTPIQSSYVYPTENNYVAINIYKAEVELNAGDVVSFEFTSSTRYNNSGIQMFVMSNANLNVIGLYNSATNNGTTFNIDLNSWYLQVARTGYYAGGNTFEYHEIDNKPATSIPTTSASSYWYGGTYVLRLQ